MQFEFIYLFICNFFSFEIFSDGLRLAADSHFFIFFAASFYPFKAIFLSVASKWFVEV